MTKPQRAPLRERIAPDPNGTHHTTDLGAHTGQVVRHPKQEGRELSGKVVAPAPRALTRVETDRRYAEELAASGMLPETYRNRPANVVWAINYARDLNLPVSTVLGNVYLSQDGKPAVTTALMSGLVRRYTWIDKDGNKHKTHLRVRMHMPSGTPDTKAYAVAQLVRADDQEFTFESSPWTLHRAERAGLVKIVEGKPWARSQRGRPLPWEKYPEAMLKARAVAEVIRDAAQDLLLGIASYTPEELGANVDEDGHPVNVGRDGEGFPVEEIDTGGLDLSGFDGPDLPTPEAQQEPEQATGGSEEPGQGKGFDPVNSTPQEWAAIVDAHMEEGDLDSLRGLYRLFRDHRPDDIDIQNLMNQVIQQVG